MYGFRMERMKVTFFFSVVFLNPFSFLKCRNRFSYQSGEMQHVNTTKPNESNHNPCDCLHKQFLLRKICVFEWIQTLFKSLRAYTNNSNGKSLHLCKRRINCIHFEILILLWNFVKSEGKMSSKQNHTENQTSTNIYTRERFKR